MEAPGIVIRIRPHDPSGHPRIGFVGAGRVGCALAVALRDGGLAGRRGGHPRPCPARARSAALVPGARAVARPAAITDAVDLVFVTVPDDALADVAAQSAPLRRPGGRAHVGRARQPASSSPAQAAGTSIGSFHPLVAFADLEAALAALPGATVALEGSEELLSMLAELATDIGAQPVTAAPGGKQAYHAAAVLAAGGFVGLLDAITEAAGVPASTKPAPSPSTDRSSGAASPTRNAWAWRRP